MAPPPAVAACLFLLLHAVISQDTMKLTGKVDATAPEDDSPTISIRQGLLKGRKDATKAGGTYYSFLGIPFGKPPTGKLRFKDPEPAESWEGTRDARDAGSICSQVHLLDKKMKGAEDCLFINVCTSQLPGGKATPLPVMVWVHGGAFIAGSGNMDLFGPDYLLDAGIVVVSFNYRLGVLGFLSTGDSTAPGNAGMKDQVLALRWVRDNIGSFGGDARNVTIFGVSAGGASVHHLMLSPLSRGLFHAAIAQSGSAVNPWAFVQEPRGRAFSLARVLGHHGNDTALLVNFLQSLEWEKLVATSLMPKNEQDKLRLFFVPFVPSAEPPSAAAFLPESPLRVLQQGKAQQVPFMTGFTPLEGLLFLKFDRDRQSPGELEKLGEHFAEAFGQDLRDGHNCAAATRLIEDFYLGSERLSNDTMKEFVEMTTDLAFVEGIVTGARLMAASGAAPVYVYQFSYDGGLNPFKSFYGGASFTGAAHGDEVGYLFRQKLSPTEVDPLSADGKTRARLLSLWTNFAKTGDPTPEQSTLVPVKWPRYQPDDRRVLDIDNELRVTDAVHRRVAFWEALYSSPQSC